MNDKKIILKKYREVLTDYKDLIQIFEEAICEFDVDNLLAEYNDQEHSMKSIFEIATSFFDEREGLLDALRERNEVYPGNCDRHLLVDDVRDMFGLTDQDCEMAALFLDAGYLAICAYEDDLVNAKGRVDAVNFAEGELRSAKRQEFLENLADRTREKTSAFSENMEAKGESLKISLISFGDDCKRTGKKVINKSSRRLIKTLEKVVEKTNV